VVDAGWEDVGTAGAYARFAQEYPMYRETSRQLVALAEPAADAAVVDLACGTGATSREVLAVLGDQGRVSGVDSSAAMLARAAESTVDSRVRWIRGAAEEVDRLVAGPVSVVLCNSAIWQTVLADVLAAVRRVLGTGGRFLFNVPQPFLADRRPRERHPMERAVELARADGWHLPHPRRPPPGRRSVAEITALITRYGYRTGAVELLTHTSTVTEQRAWLAIPIFTEHQLPGIPYAERMRLLDRVYEDVDPAGVVEGVWTAFVAIAC
jgi:SAM-dependent methyltransferase